MAALAGAAFNSKHARGQGGQFAAASSAASGKPTGAWASGPMRFDGKSGTGYGTRGGDARVRALQSALNKLGLGGALTVDGKLGPRTTAAIKQMQQRLGLKADGVVTAALMVRILTAAAKTPARKAAPRAAGRKTKAKTPAGKKNRYGIVHVPRPGERGYKAPGPF